MKTMRKAKAVLILSVLVICTLLALGLYKLNSDEKELLTLQFDKIQMGMGVDEVTTLVGQPDYDSACEKRYWGYYSLDSKERWTVVFDSAGKVIKKEHYATPDEVGLIPDYNRLVRKLTHKVYKEACG